nr:hypothetical protein [Tanacetum cinerariifolium]
MSIRFAPTGWCRIKEVPRCSLRGAQWQDSRVVIVLYGNRLGRIDHRLIEFKGLKEDCFCVFIFYEREHSNQDNDNNIIENLTTTEVGQNSESLSPSAEDASRLNTSTIQINPLLSILVTTSPAPQDKWTQDKHTKLVNIIGNLGVGMLTRAMPKEHGAASAHECLFVDFLSEKETKKASEALKHPRWVDAMQEELNQFSKNKVWTLVPAPYGKTIIVARLEAIRIFLAFAIYINFTLYRMDVKSYFLNEKLKEEVYVKQPSGFESSEFPNHVCKLDKALYGFKQAPKACLDYAGCNIDRKSTLGACQLLGGKLVCWSAKKQQFVAMSSGEAEFVAAAGYYFIRDHIMKGDIELHFILAQYQLADIFTKPRDEPSFKRLIAKLVVLRKDRTFFGLSFDVAALGRGNDSGPDASLKFLHPNATINDPRPAVGSFLMADVIRLSEHVIKLRDMPEGVLVLSGLSHVWKSRVYDLTSAEVQEEPHQDIRLTFQRLLFYCTHVAPANAIISNLTPKDLVVGTPSAKVIAKPEASQKQNAYTSSATSSHVAKHTGRPRPSFGPAPSLRDIFRDAIHMDFFPFYSGPYYATYPEGGIAGSCEFTRKEWDAPHQPNLAILTKEVFKDPSICKTMVDQFPTPWEMVQVEALFDDQLNAKMSVLHSNSRSKGYEERVAGLSGLELQVSALRRQFFVLSGKLPTSDASFAKSRSKGKERNKKIKSLTKSLDNLHAELARLSADLNRATVLEAEKDEEILCLKATPLEFASFFHASVPALKDSRVSPLMMEEWINAMVDMPDQEMTDVATNGGSKTIFVQGVSHVVNEAGGLREVQGLKRVSFDPPDVVIALSVGEKGGDSPNSTRKPVVALASVEESAANPSGVSALEWNLEEIHVTWAHLEKKQTRLRTYTKSLEESCSQSVETLRDMPEGVLVLSGLSRVWKSRVYDLTSAEVQEEPHQDIRLTFQRLLFDCTYVAPANAVISNPTLKDLVVGTPSAKGESYVALAAEGPSTRGGIAGNCEFSRKEWDAPHQPNLAILTKEVEALFDDQLNAKITNSRSKGYKERVAGLAGLELQVSALRRQVFVLSGKLPTSDASFAKSRSKGKERNKKIKSLTKILDNLHAELARLSADLNQATILEAEKAEEILCLKATPLEFASFFHATNVHESMKTCKSFVPLLTKVTIPANSALQSMLWSDVLKFKQMAYEYIFSLGLTRIIPTPKPSLIDSLPRCNLQALGVGVSALEWNLEEIHVTWAHLEKKQTRLRTYTKSLEESCSQSVETGSQA